MGHVATMTVSYRTASLLQLPSVLHPFISPSPQVLGNYWSVCYLLGFAFPRIPYSWNHAVCGLCRLASFLTVYIQVSSIIFYGLETLFSLLLDNILLCDNHCVYPSTYQRISQLLQFQLLKIKMLWTFMGRFLWGPNFQLILVNTK